MNRLLDGSQSGIIDHALLKGGRVTIKLYVQFEILHFGVGTYTPTAVSKQVIKRGRKSRERNGRRGRCYTTGDKMSCVFQEDNNAQTILLLEWLTLADMFPLSSRDVEVRHLSFVHSVIGRTLGR